MAETMTLARFYPGWPEYQQLLVAAIAPLTDEQLKLGTPHHYPLWQLAAHIISCRIGWFHHRLGEGPTAPEYLAMYDWDLDDAPPRTAAELVAGLEQTWAMIADCLARWTPDDLADNFTWEREGRTVNRTRAWIIWHVLEHDIYHGGEMSLTLGTHELPALGL